jgi:hypothetical protein
MDAVRRLDGCRGRLRGLLAERGLPLRAIDRRLGWRPGRLARLLRPGSPEIGLGELLAVLDVTGLSAAAFFAGLEPPQPLPRARPGAAFDLADLLDCIAAAVRRELAGSEGRGPSCDARARRRAPGALR